MEGHEEAVSMLVQSWCGLAGVWACSTQQGAAGLEQLQGRGRDVPHSSYALQLAHLGSCCCCGGRAALGHLLQSKHSAQGQHER